MQPVIRSPKQLGDAIRRHRRNRSLSQTEVANRAHLRQATLSSIESGSPGTQLDTLFDVLAALDLELVVRSRTKASADEIERIF